MALYAFDGTGNEDRDGIEKDSNVLHFFEAYQDSTKNSDPKAERGSLYLKGIGTMAQTLVGDKVAAAFGFGGRRRLRAAHRRVEHNVAAGDTDVDIIGFSRGAALAIDFANHVCQKVPNANVRFVGVWDIVAQFGVPGRFVNVGFDLDCPDVTCYHAMAIDENRAFFPLTRLAKKGQTLAKLREVWFRGVHSDVGGGNGNRGLNWITLDWMFRNAQRHAVPIEPAAIDANRRLQDLARAVSVHEIAVGPHRDFATGDAVHDSVQFSDDERQRLLDPQLAISTIDDAGMLAPFRPATRNA